MKFKSASDRRLALVALLQTGYWSFAGAAIKLGVPFTVVVRDMARLRDAGVRLVSDGAVRETGYRLWSPKR